MAWIAAAILLVAVTLLVKRRFAIWVALALAIVGAIIWYFTEAESRRQSDEKAAVTVTATANPATCTDPNRPVAVEFANQSDRPIDQLSFDLIGMPQGQTTVAYRAFLKDDQLVPVGQVVTRCYGLLFHGFAHPRPQIIDATKYSWSAHITLVSFGENVTQ